MSSAPKDNSMLQHTPLPTSKLAVAVLGSLSQDEYLVLEHELQPGFIALVKTRLRLGGGLAANIALVLQHLGVSSFLVTKVSQDSEGQNLVNELRSRGLPVWLVPHSGKTRVGRRTILLTPSSEQTVLWEPGARLQMGDLLPLEAILQCPIVVLAVDDPDLYQFLLDLPVHIAPRTRMLGLLPALATLPSQQSQELALRFDVLVGSAHNLAIFMSQTTAPGDLGAIQEWMGQGLTRLIALTDKRRALYVTRQEVREAPLLPGHPIWHLFDLDAAFAAAVLAGLVARLSLKDLAHFSEHVTNLMQKVYVWAKTIHEDQDAAL